MTHPILYRNIILRTTEFWFYGAIFLGEDRYRASMVGYPYDDVEWWSGIYPADVYEDELLRIVREEMETVQTLVDLQLQDSRIGFESSNHYFYTLQDLKEKMINLAYCEEKLM